MNLLEVLTPRAHAEIPRLQERMVRELRRVLERYEIEAQVIALGTKGCITYRTRPLNNNRDFLAVDGRYAHGAGLHPFNGGVRLPPWAERERLVGLQWT